MFCCRVAEPAKDPLASLANLREALDVKLHAKHYELQEILMRAKQFHRDQNMIRARAELVRYKQKEQTYKRYVETHSKVCMIWDEIENTHDFVDIAGGFKDAHGVLERLLKRLNVDDLDKLVDNLEEQLMDAEEIGISLAGTTDEDVDLSELDILLPSIGAHLVPDAPRENVVEQRGEPAKLYA